MPQHGNEYACVENKNDSVVRDEKHFSKIREMVRKHLESAYERSKKRYNLRSNRIQYNVGDTVYRTNMKLSDAGAYYSSKLAPRKIKCEIIGKTGTNTYLLRDWDSNKQGVYHAEKFHHY